MKRIISIILCFSFLFLLTSCGGKDSKKNGKNKLDLAPHIKATGALLNVTITEKGGDEGDVDDHVIKITEDMKYSSVMVDGKLVEEIIAKVDDQWYRYTKNGAEEKLWYRSVIEEGFDPAKDTLSNCLEFFWYEDIFEQLAASESSFYEKDGAYVLDSLTMHNDLSKIPESVIEAYDLYTGFDGSEVILKNIIITVDTNYITTMKFTYASPLTKEDVNISYSFTSFGETEIALPAYGVVINA